MTAKTRHGGQGGNLGMTVSRDGDARVVLTGALTSGDVPMLQDALAVLLHDVDRVLVDITGLAITHTSLLGAFADAVDQAGGWPAVRLAVVYGGRTMGQALRASRVAGRVAVADEPELALMRCAEQPMEVRARWSFPAAVDTPARCRDAARLRLASWSLPDEDVVPAIVVLNELVTNAVLHANTAVDVGLVLDGAAVWARVRDFDRQPVALTTLQSRLGLRLVEGLASRWGIEFHEDGKTAWARLPR